MARKKKQSKRPTKPANQGPDAAKAAGATSSARPAGNAAAQPAASTPSPKASEPGAAAEGPSAARSSASPKRAKGSGFRAFGRFGVAVQVIVQMLLATIIFAQVNYIGCRRYERWDLTQSGRFTLSTVSRNFLDGLDNDIVVIMAFMKRSDLFSEVEGMLSEYERQSHDRLRIEVLDLSRNRDRLAELKDLHGVEFNRNMLVVISDNRVKVIGAEDLVRRSNAGHVSQFNGEEILTSTLLEVAEKQQKKVYLLGGNRVMDELMAIGQQLVDLAAMQNVRVESLNLGTANAIPTDAEAIVLAGPTVDFNARELELVEDYWGNRGGSLLVFLNPSAETPNLFSFIRRQGIAPQNDRILSMASIPGIASRKTYDVPINFLPVRPGLPGTEITRELFGIAATLVKQTQSLKVFQDDELLAADGVRVAALAVADPRFWGETEYREDIVAADETQDNTDLLYTAAAVEKTPQPPASSAATDDGATDDKPKPSRMVVISNDQVLDPSGNTQKPNADFVMNSLNWLIDRSELIGIAPRKPTSYSLSISPGQFGLLQSLAILVLPAAALLLGALIWFLRRR